MAVNGPTGSGKTFTALLLAMRIVDDPSQIAIIDTEDGSAGLYAPSFEGADQIEHVIWEPPYDPRDLAEETKMLAQDGYRVIILDSLSHFWNEEGGTKDIVDNAAAGMKNPNRFAAWKHGTAAQRQLVGAIKRTPAHMIVTMRSKMEYVQEGGQVRKVGMQPEQRDGLEYELDVIVDMDLDHIASLTKTRFSELNGRQFPPGKTIDLADLLLAEVNAAKPLATDEQRNAIIELAKQVPPAERTRISSMAKELFGSIHRVAADDVDSIIAWYTDELAAVELIYTPDAFVGEVTGDGTGEALPPIIDGDPTPAGIANGFDEEAMREEFEHASREAADR